MTGLSSLTWPINNYVWHPNIWDSVNLDGDFRLNNRSEWQKQTNRHSNRIECFSSPESIQLLLWTHSKGYQKVNLGHLCYIGTVCVWFVYGSCVVHVQLYIFCTNPSRFSACNIENWEDPGHNCKWNMLAHLGQNHGSRQPWIGSTCGASLTIVSRSCGLYKPVFCAATFVDYSIKCRSENNKSYPRIRTALD